jgi:hypothetical protein
MRSHEFIKEMTDAEVAKLHSDADSRLKKDLDSQSDARIAALKNPPKKKGFMAQVGDKIIGGVKGAAKGFAGGTAAIKEDADAAGTTASTIGAVVKSLGETPTEMIRRQKSYTNQLSKGGAVKVKKSK